MEFPRIAWLNTWRLAQISVLLPHLPTTRGCLISPDFQSGQLSHLAFSSFFSLATSEICLLASGLWDCWQTQYFLGRIRKVGFHIQLGFFESGLLLIR